MKMSLSYLSKITILQMKKKKKKKRKEKKEVREVPWSAATSVECPHLCECAACGGTECGDVHAPTRCVPHTTHGVPHTRHTHTRRHTETLRDSIPVKKVKESEQH